MRVGPDGSSQRTVSPTRAPVSDRATGEIQLTFPDPGSASSTPTMRTRRSHPGD